MTRVKLYSTETGTVETVKVIDYPHATAAAERRAAMEVFDRLVAQDRSTDHVYYLSS